MCTAQVVLVNGPLLAVNWFAMDVINVGEAGQLAIVVLVAVACNLLTVFAFQFIEPWLSKDSSSIHDVVRAVSSLPMDDGRAECDEGHSGDPERVGTRREAQDVLCIAPHQQPRTPTSSMPENDEAAADAVFRKALTNQI